MKIRTEYGEKHMRYAIETIEGVVTRAAEIADRDDQDDLERARGIIHEFQWAMANAMTQLETAIRNYRRHVEMMLVQQEVQKQ